MEELQEHFVEMLEQCIENGMKLPFIVCSVSRNGSVLATRINEGRGPDTLAQHYEEHGFQTPINIIVVDHYGQAALAEIEGGKISYH